MNLTDASMNKCKTINNNLRLKKGPFTMTLTTQTYKSKMKMETFLTALKRTYAKKTKRRKNKSINNNHSKKALIRSNKIICPRILM